MADNQSTLDNLLKSVLSVGNKEQNFGYPPKIFSEHFNITTGLLITALSEAYPNKSDALLPFIKQDNLVVKNGTVELPEDYRNLIGAPSINVRPDGTDCSSPVSIDTAAEFKTANLKAGCKTRPIEILSKKEFDYRTTSSYAYPTFENPIAYFSGNNELKVCPYDITKVQITYAKKEKICRYGYVMNPDDTYFFDLSTSIESEWGNAAFPYLFKALVSLYSAYSRDQNIQDWSLVLREGIL